MMKYILINSLMLFLTTVVFSQTKISQPSEFSAGVREMNKPYFTPIANGKNVFWIVKNEIWDRAIIDTLSLSDTISIDSKLYRKVIYSSENYQGKDGIAGYFREDTLSGKAWFQGRLDSTEYMIMDLSLKKGDSIFVKMIYGSKYAHIVNEEIVNGKKVLTTDHHFGGGFISEDLKFIEGVGPNATIMYQIDEPTAAEINQKFGYMVCKMFNNTELVYAWDTINYQCGPLWDYVDEIKGDEILIFPNPVNETLSIKCLKETQFSATIFNASGTVKERVKLLPFETQINVSEYNKGIYFIRIGSINKKFIVL